MLYGFEKASENPAAFFREVRDEQDPLIGRRGRTDAGADRRESHLTSWETFFPPGPSGTRTRRRATKSADNP